MMGSVGKAGRASQRKWHGSQVLENEQSSRVAPEYGRHVSRLLIGPWSLGDAADAPMDRSFPWIACFNWEDEGWRALMDVTSW